MTEIMKKAEQLGQLIKKDRVCTDLFAARDAYEQDEELNRLFTEYNVQQQALTNEYAKETVDTVLTEQINRRINELQEKITAHPLFVAYGEAEEAYMEFMKMVQDEISFQVTGRRACSGSCSSCEANCPSKQ